MLSKLPGTTSFSRRVRFVLFVMLVAVLSVPGIKEFQPARSQAEEAAKRVEDLFDDGSNTGRAAAVPNEEDPFGAGQRAAPAPQAGPAGKAKPVEFLPPLTPAEEKIIKELDSPTTMEFTETPLADAVEYLKDLHGIEIQLDGKELEEIGLGSDTPVTRVLKGITLRSALRLLLEQHHLAFDIRDEVLLITSADRAKTWVITRTYPVGDLVEGNDFDELIAVITGSVGPWTVVASRQTAQAPPPPPKGELRLSILPADRSRSLVISQSRDAHDQILELLRSLRQAAAVSERNPN